MIATVVTAIAVCALALDTVRPPASAAEAGESTTGTASTISPSTVAVGGTLTYTLSGFPPGATIQISVDDDTLGAQGPGQSVIGTATVDDHGITSGAVELPIYLAKGSHWLRFGVSAGRDIPTSEVRTMDYTNKSPYFTVGDVTIIGGSDTGRFFSSARHRLPDCRGAGVGVSHRLHQPQHDPDRYQAGWRRRSAACR